MCIYAYTHEPLSKLLTIALQFGFWIDYILVGLSSGRLDEAADVVLGSDVIWGPAATDFTSPQVVCLLGCLVIVYPELPKTLNLRELRETN